MSAVACIINIQDIKTSYIRYSGSVMHNSEASPYRDQDYKKFNHTARTIDSPWPSTDWDVTVKSSEVNTKWILPTVHGRNFHFRLSHLQLLFPLFLCLSHYSIVPTILLPYSIHVHLLHHAWYLSERQDSHRGRTSVLLVNIRKTPICLARFRPPDPWWRDALKSCLRAWQSAQVGSIGL